MRHSYYIAISDFRPSHPDEARFSFVCHVVRLSRLRYIDSKLRACGRTLGGMAEVVAKPIEDRVVDEGDVVVDRQPWTPVGAWRSSLQSRASNAAQALVAARLASTIKLLCEDYSLHVSRGYNVHWLRCESVFVAYTWSMSTQRFIVIWTRWSLLF